MSKQVTVKYYSDSEFAKEPYQATEDSAGYDLFAAETKTILPTSVGIISLDLRWAIPTSFYGKLFPHSGILKDHFVTIDVDVIDADFRGIIKVLILSHHPEKILLFVLKIELNKLFFIEKFNANSHRVSDAHL